MEFTKFMKRMIELMEAKGLSEKTIQYYLDRAYRLNNKKKFKKQKNIIQKIQSFTIFKKSKIQKFEETKSVCKPTLGQVGAKIGQVGAKFLQILTKWDPSWASLAPKCHLGRSLA